MAKQDERATIGRNTVSGQMLIGYIERLERIAADKKQLSEDEKAVYAEMSANGFSPKRTRDVLKIRKQKPADRAEALAELDMYLHAVGMEAEAPLFRSVGLMNVDIAARDQVIAAFMQLVPQTGEIIVKIGDQPVRLYRDAEGVAHAEDYVEKATGSAPSRPASAGRSARDVPAVDEMGAYDLGKKAFHENQPITSNPFPWDDKRRSRFDAGWRDASGSDGMGPET